MLSLKRSLTQTALLLSLHFAAILGTAGCGDSSRNSTLNSSETDRKPLLVVSGGFGSCKRVGGLFDPRPMNVAVETRKLVAELKSAGFGAIDTVISCFAVALVNPSETIHYILSSEPSMIYSGSREEFYSSVARFANAEPNRVTFVAGHSYGGWNAAQLALKLKLSSGIATLTTIDPISPINCRPGNFLAGGLDQDGDGEGGCREAPADLTKQDRDQIQGNVGSWSNFYQKNYFRLHSSEIPVAKVNQQIHFDNSVRNAHVAIDSDPAVWKAIREGITGVLGPVSTPPPASSSPNRDLFLLIGQTTSGVKNLELMVSSNSNVVKVDICSGAMESCLATPNVALSFVQNGVGSSSGGAVGSSVASRSVFRGTTTLAVEEKAPFTILGMDSSGAVVSARTVTFVSK